MAIRRQAVRAARKASVPGAIAQVASQAISTTGDVKIKALDNKAVGVKEGEETKRRKIDADVKKVEIKQKAFTKRYGTLGESLSTFRNTSDEILLASDRPFYECNWRQGGKKHRISISTQTMAGLAPVFDAIAKKQDDYIIGDLARDYRTIWTDIITNAEQLKRVANAGDMDYSLPAEDLSPQDPEPPAPPEPPEIPVQREMLEIEQDIEKAEKKVAKTLVESIVPETWLTPPEITKAEEEKIKKAVKSKEKLEIEKYYNQVVEIYKTDLSDLARKSLLKFVSMHSAGKKAIKKWDNEQKKIKEEVTEDPEENR